MTEQEMARLKKLCRDVYAMSLDYPETPGYKENYNFLNNLYGQNLPKEVPVVVPETVPATVPPPTFTATTTTISAIPSEE